MIDVSIQDIFLKQTNLEEENYSKYAYVDTGITDYYYKDSSLSSYGDADRITENAVITSENPVQGYDKCLVVVKSSLIDLKLFNKDNKGQAGKPCSLRD